MPNLVARLAICSAWMLVLCGGSVALAGCAAEERKPAEPSIAIVGATLVHPERDGAKALAPNSTIVITGNRIDAVGPSGTIAVPAGSTIIDGRGKWVAPGLVDAHVHFFQSGNLYTRPDAADFNAWMPYAKEVERNKARLPATFKVWLASGVTTVVDIGGPFWNFDMRDSAERTKA
ncbi:MAG TPA: amidohydrolase, partial [Casimicrobiaceae bacterium]